MTTTASARQLNCSTSSSSSRRRPLKDSTNGFCQGDPGSMNAVPAWRKRHQSLSACAVSSGPLSQRTCAGAPRLVGEALEHVDGLVCVDAARDVDRERFAGELVDDVEQLQHAAIGGLIELEVQRPDMVGPLRSQPVGRDGRLAEALALAAESGAPEAFFAPEPLDALAVDVVAELAEADMRAAVAPTRPRGRDLAQQRPQHQVGVDRVGVMALGGAVLPGDSACPALADTEAVLEHQDRSAPAGWAHQFPLAISFSACASSA